MKSLFDQVKIGNITLKNRCVMAPMGTVLANEVGGVTPSMIEYYRQRALGGCGLIIVENAAVTEIRNPCRLSIHNDNFIAGLNDLCTVIKEYGINAFIQLAHKGFGSAAPYRAEQKDQNDTINQLSQEEIKTIVDKFSQAAKRAKTAGFDGVDIHACHWYLINKFLSPYYNKRTDLYGGNFDKRMRFAIEILEAIKKETGDEYPVIFRINGSDYLDGGLCEEDAAQISMELERHGASAIHISGGLPDSIEYLNTPMGFKEACHEKASVKIKEHVNIPVILTGNIHRAELAETLIAEGKADLISLGRAVLADPNFPNKAQERRYQDIRPCISCNNCVGRVHSGLRIECTVNPWLKKEPTFDANKEPKQKMLVIGGGVAGMQAAVILGKRGYQCFLFEKASRLGGLLNIADLGGKKPEITHLLKYMQHQLQEAEVTVNLNTQVDQAILQEYHPDFVILAAGSKSYALDYPTSCQPKIYDSREVLANDVSVGNKIIIIGGGQTGCECAVMLSNGQRSVSIVEQQNNLAMDAEIVYRQRLMKELAVRKVEVLTNSKAKEIKNETIIVENQSGEKSSILYEGIVFALGGKPDISMEPELKRIGIKYARIGDCNKPGKIIDAIKSAANVASSIGLP